MKRKKLLQTERICIDLDDTLVDYNRALREWHNREYGTSLKPEDFTSYFFNEVWGGTMEEAIRKVDEFEQSEDMEKIALIEGAVNAVDVLLHKGKKLFVGTSRQIGLKEKTEDLINRYFRGKFLDVIFSSNHYRLSGGKTKVKICRDLRALLVDDSLEYVVPCIDEGMGAVLFGNYAWNQFNGHIGMPRAENWKKFLELVGVKP